MSFFCMIGKRRFDMVNVRAVLLINSNFSPFLCHVAPPGSLFHRCIKLFVQIILFNILLIIREILCAFRGHACEGFCLHVTIGIGRQRYFYSFRHFEGLPVRVGCCRVWEREIVGHAAALPLTSASRHKCTYLHAYEAPSPTKKRCTSAGHCPFTV